MGSTYFLGIMPNPALDSTVIVQRAGTDALSGAAFVAAYGRAAALTPGGNACTPANPATLLVPPGKYVLSELFRHAANVNILAPWGEAQFQLAASVSAPYTWFKTAVADLLNIRILLAAASKYGLALRIANDTSRYENVYDETWRAFFSFDNLGGTWRNCHATLGGGYAAWQLNQGDVDPDGNWGVGWLITGTFTECGGMAQTAKAAASTVHAVAQSNLTFTAVAAGWDGNKLNVSYTAGGTAGAEVVTVLGTGASVNINVQIDTANSTAAQIKTALEASTAAALVAVALKTGNDGTGKPGVTLGPLYLTGGQGVEGGAIEDGTSCWGGVESEARAQGTGGYTGTFTITATIYDKVGTLVAGPTVLTSTAPGAQATVVDNWLADGNIAAGAWAYLTATDITTYMSILLKDRWIKLGHGCKLTLAGTGGATLAWYAGTASPTIYFPGILDATFDRCVGGLYSFGGCASVGMHGSANLACYDIIGGNNSMTAGSRNWGRIYGARLGQSSVCMDSGSAVRTAHFNGYAERVFTGGAGAFSAGGYGAGSGVSGVVTNCKLIGLVGDVWCEEGCLFEGNEIRGQTTSDQQMYLLHGLSGSNNQKFYDNTVVNHWNSSATVNKAMGFFGTIYAHGNRLSVAAAAGTVVGTNAAANVNY